MYFGGLAYLKYLPQYFEDLMNFFPGHPVDEVIVHTLVIIVGPIAFYFAFKYVMDNIYNFVNWTLKKLSVD